MSARCNVRSGLSSCFTVAGDCMKLDLIKRVNLESLMGTLKSRVALSTDVWSSMSMKMKEMFDRYCGSMGETNSMMFTAVALDPQFKLKFSKFCCEGAHGNQTGKVDRMLTNLKVELSWLFEFCHDVLQTQTSQPDASDDIHQFHLFMRERHKRDVKTELDLYLEQRCEKIMKMSLTS